MENKTVSSKKVFLNEDNKEMKYYLTEDENSFCVRDRDDTGIVLQISKNPDEALEEIARVDSFTMALKLISIELELPF